MNTNTDDPDKVQNFNLKHICIKYLFTYKTREH